MSATITNNRTLELVGFALIALLILVILPATLDIFRLNLVGKYLTYAFVALGRYYLNGIPNSKIKADSDRAREMFSYAASYFGNADAQYDLARLYLKTPDASRDDFRYGARWLGLAAQKGQHQAQAMLGQMLFNGDRMPPQRARGLMWLTLARDSAAPDEAWIRESYNRAIAKANDDDRAMALQMLEHWVQGKKD